MFVKKFAQLAVVTLEDEPVVSNGCGNGVGSVGGLSASGTGGIDCCVWEREVVGEAIWEAEAESELEDGEAEVVRMEFQVIDLESVSAKHNVWRYRFKHIDGLLRCCAVRL